MFTQPTLLRLLLIVVLLQTAWSRTLSVTLNLSLNGQEAEASKSIDSTATPQPQLTQNMLHICMHETELSMSQLKLFHISLLSHTTDGTTTGVHNENELALDESTHGGDADYVNNPALPFLEVQQNAPLQCFVRCLYEHLDLIQYDVLLEEVFKAQVQHLVQRGSTQIKECMDLQGANRCEAAYKLHLCYNQLKALKAEQRIREVLERNAGEAKRKAMEDAALEQVDDEADDVGNVEVTVIGNGSEHSEENTIEGN